ncbi:MAG: hypothetical protein J5I93_11890 [Pirellulaceae bacterium]|nr:hypothetical protein [Pirellulaceae bacterium]
MTALDAPLAGKSPADAPTDSYWLRLERTLERASERLNPILVKEARQALKSRQFVVTFSLLLCFGWGWTVLGILLLCLEMGLTGVAYAPSGRFMLIGYYIVLAIPLLIVVPFSAFRSLAAEREDGTFELLSITTLSARQIVLGKLGSSLMQMLVYYSALSPCIAFTYLLRGIDIVTILLVLVYTFLASLMLSALGLLVATATRTMIWQVFLSVILLGILFAGAYMWSMFVIFFIIETPPLDDQYFWIANLACVSFYASFLLLFLEAAGSQLSFASDNRSTRLRWLMLAQQVLLIGWVLYGWRQIDETEFLMVLSGWAAVYWGVTGSMMIGESGQLSPRALRELPQSFLGRTLLTWFNPGSGTGYVFAVSNMFVCAVVALAAGVSDFAQGTADFEELLWFSVMATAYLVAYLGVVRLLLLLIRRVQHAGIALSLLLLIILLLAGAGAPFFLDLAFNEFRDSTYTVWQSTNWVRVLYECLDDNLLQEPLVPVVVLVAAGGILLLNLILAAREVEQVRQETPERVREDEQERRAARRKHDAAATWAEAKGSLDGSTL